MEKIGIVTQQKWQTLTWPTQWKGYFKDVTRDNITLKKLSFHIDELATVENINQFEQIFTSHAECDAWLNTTDEVQVVMISFPLTNDKTFPTFTRTATALSFTSIDFQRNNLTLRVAIKTYNTGVEQKQLYKEVEIAVNNGYGASLIKQLDSNTSISTVVSAIIKEKTI